MKLLGIPLLILIVISAVGVASIYIACNAQGSDDDQDFYFGVSFGGNTTAEAKLLIDKVKDYSNYFLINSYDLSNNETALNEICDYAAEADLHFTVYFFSLYNSTWKIEWVEAASHRWGEKFLGVYLRDEPGGRQIDLNETVPIASNFSDAADKYVDSISSSFSMHTLNSKNIPVFTSDYALYYFDYLAGHDIVFVELGWNVSRTQQIGLCRGAANVLDKDWGAIITRTYMEPPYITSGPEILQDMYTAYEAGAKYIVVFNWPVHPEGNPYGILTEEHFEAMQQFWDYTQTDGKAAEKITAQVALLLPEDYGVGLRHLNEKIWGLWQPDNDYQQIWQNINKLSDRYGLKLDIIYNDGKIDPAKIYKNVYLWNQTIP
jgi:hypothetical protein